MAITFENTLVFLEGQKIGKIKKWCCGVDYHPDKYNCLFSIVKVKWCSEELKICIEKLNTLQIEPVRYFHANFNMEHATNEDLFRRYESVLNNKYGYRGFKVHEQRGGIQVYPANDIQPHKMNLSCNCYPTLRVNQGLTIVRHHPFDGRTLTDEDKRMLGES